MFTSAAPNMMPTFVAVAVPELVTANVTLIMSPASKVATVFSTTVPDGVGPASAAEVGNATSAVTAAATANPPKICATGHETPEVPPM